MDDHVPAREADQRGQASIEAVAALPLLMLGGLLALQLLAAGYSLTLADGAAESGALALVAGRSEKAVKTAARIALPGWAKERVRVSVSGGSVKVRLSPPSPFAEVADRLAVTSVAHVRPPRG